MLQPFCKSRDLVWSLTTTASLLASGVLIGGMLFDAVSSSRPDETGSTRQDASSSVIASNQREPFAVPHSGLDVISNHFQR